MTVYITVFLKVGLSGIAKRYGYQTVQDFYRVYHTVKNAYADFQREQSAQQSEQTKQRKDRGAR